MDSRRLTAEVLRRGHARIVFTVCLIAACADTPAISPLPTPVVSMVLIAGEARHLAAITWDSPIPGPIPAQPTPVDASDVDLEIVDENGVPYSVEPDDRAGHFFAELAVSPGRRYRLVGTIKGVQVSGETVVPSGFAMPEPSGDTVVVDLSAGPFWEMPYRFEVDGGSAFVLQVSSPDGVQPNGSVTNPSDTLRVPFLVNPGSPPYHLRVLALDQAAAGWLLSQVPQSNVHGAFGGFGSAAVLVRPLIIE